MLSWRLFLVTVFILACLSLPAQQPYAVIAGGSKGIGFAVAEALAKRGFNLVLIARHEDGLIKAKDFLTKTYSINVETLQLDLADSASALRVRDFCLEKKLPVKLLANVAGLGGTRDFGTLPIDSLRYMIHLNVESTVVLTYVMIPLLEKQKPAYILNVASMAGFAPIPSKNLYSTTKAAVVAFSYNLRYQLEDRGISVTYLAPGPVFTKPEIIETTKKNMGWVGMQMAVKPSKAGEAAVRRTLKGRMVVVPGTLAFGASQLLRILPKRWSSGIYNRLDKNKQGD
ncbi:SDR family NAD(P)-dependent oxidoreductase [Flavihumibacter petaseus]|uniref:Putative oxidoreductase n=1 Tax=Flavihumibacter petaseus NBRC 106054 TaxID=1220578 RepID=A0A0E9MWS6_9BACT|nr:SDR family NAD(P)-dependent oxidoreductase [Flavihumibacter petaseus]GAO41570.1 putative oxidoreductase [Flavihumibacter petaseus NBRC 106054]